MLCIFFVLSFLTQGHKLLSASSLISELEFLHFLFCWIILEQFVILLIFPLSHITEPVYHSNNRTQIF